MADSLVVNGIIELLGGGVVSTQPDAAGAIYRLGKDFDLSAPQMTTEKVAGLLLAGERVTTRASNRTPKIPVVIGVPSTGDLVADRLTLSAARELLLQATSQDRWQLTWTRDGGLPFIFDCQGLSAVVVNHSLIYARALVSLVEITFEALPFGRSDDAELLVFPAPSQIWDQPPAPVVIDSMTAVANFLAGDATGFESGIANWIAAGNCTVAQSAAQFHSGTKSLALTATAAATMQARHCNPANVADSQTTGQGLKCQPGDTVSVGAFSRTAVTARSVNVGADFYDATGTFISTLRGSNVTNSSANFTTNPVATLTAPAGAVYAIASPQVVTPANGEVHYFDDVSINRGAVASADDGQAWSLSTVTAVTSQNSAKWSRIRTDSPIYDRTLSAAVDITGRAKLTFWLGLATTVSGYADWHKGTVTVAATLYDPQGDAITFGAKQVKAVASGLISKPHWQLMNMHIPQSVGAFDYTQVVRYTIQVWSHWSPTRPQPELRATAYLCSVTAAPTATGALVTRGAWYTLPGIVGTVRSPLAVQLQPGTSSFSTVADFTTPGVANWTCPVGVTAIDKTETWGSGGGGAGANGTPFGGGGGGAGAYAMKRSIPVTPATVYHPNVPAAGNGGTVGNQGQSGGDAWFIGDSNKQVRANAGRGGWVGQVWGGGKGGGESSDADLSYAGGNGRQSNVNGDDGGRGGGGGSSGGTGAPGKDCFGRPGADPVTGGGPGGPGGQLTGTPHTGGTPPTGPGGGGGGGAILDDGSKYAGAAGANGRVRLTYGATGILPLASALVHMPGRDAHPQLSPLCPAGTGTDVPNGSTDYTVPPVGALAARFDGSYSLYVVANTWNNPSAARTLTVTVKQFAYSGGPSITQALARTLTPNADVVNGYVEMGVVTLPLAEISPGNTDSYFAVSILDTNTSDRFYDILFLDSQGQTALLNMSVAAFAQNIWLDVPDLDRDLGGIFGSDTDRDRARSLLASCDPVSTRISGGPLSVVPNGHNRILVYAQQGNPALSITYFPRWWQDRLS